MSPRDLKHVDALTSLRFFAAFYVLIFHSGAPALRASGVLPQPVANFLANGYLGVPFFFILSGFVLTYVYLGRLEPEGAVRRYALARFARVYPVYLLSLLLMIPFVPATGLAPVAAILFGAIIALTPTSLVPGPLRSVLTHPAMVLLGGASYAIYILQLPVHELVGAVFAGPYDGVGKFAYFPILIGLSILVYLWLEEPLRELLRSARRRAPIAAE